MPTRDDEYLQEGGNDSDVEIMEQETSAPRLTAKEKGKGRASQSKREQPKPKEVQRHVKIVLERALNYK
jgi:hypothetical protein